MNKIHRIAVIAGDGIGQEVMPEGIRVLDAAAREYAKRGDEGRAEASYRMLLQISPEAEDAKSHLAALGAWGAAGTSALIVAGEKARSTQTRQLLEPTADAHADAEKTTLRWLDEAFLLRDRHRKMQGAPTQQEASEALRAFQTGPSLLAAIHLRSANAAAAKAALELPNVHPLVREDLMKLIEKVSKDPSAEAWLDLSRALRPADGDDDAESAPILRAASFAAAAEAYRLDPTEPSAALTTVIWLSDIGMADAAPGVLVAAVKKVQDPRFVSLALNVAFDGMVAALEHEDPAQARLIYKEAAPLLEVARKKEFAGKLSFAKLSTEDYPQYAEENNVQGIPCLIIFKNGKEVERIVGFAPKPVMKAKIAGVLASLK